MLETRKGIFTSFERLKLKENVRQLSLAKIFFLYLNILMSGDTSSKR